MKVLQGIQTAFKLVEIFFNIIATRANTKKEDFESHFKVSKLGGT